MQRRTFPIMAISLLVIGCGSEDRVNDPWATGGTDGSASATASATATAGSASATGGTDGSATATDSGSASDTADTSETADSSDTAGTDTGAKFDVGGSDLGSVGCNNPDGECGCSFVDLLFVIDNSGSMGSYQSALAMAFPLFADTLVSALPAGTNVHVGVTTTEMGYSSMGSTSISNNMCTFTGDGGQSNEAFYITPDQMATTRPGAQGRLYKPNGGPAYFDFDTNGGDLAGLKSWFSQAAQIGEGGSNIEMLTAPVGWVPDPANAATNGMFLRDAGAVTVVFFMQDEPDQTPMMADGIAAGTAMLNRLAAAKSTCGGVNCIIAGGFLNDNACGGRPIDDFLGGLPQSPNIAKLPSSTLAKNNPAAAAAEMNQLLSDVLASVIAKKCEEIPPVG